MGIRALRSLCLSAVALAVVVVVAGCGGGSSSDSTGTASETTSSAAAGGGEISDTAFLKQANEICEEGKKESVEKMGAYVRKLKKESGGSKKQLLSHLREAIQAVIVPGIAEQVEEIRALDVSGADKATVDEFLAAMEEGVESAEEAKGSSTAPFAKSFKPSAELAHEIGLDGCAYG